MFSIIIDVGLTVKGEECRNKCGFNGELFNWCLTVPGSDYYWDYCNLRGKIPSTFYQFKFLLH